MQNKGIEDFIENKIPYFARIRTPLIANIAGENEDDFGYLARALNRHKKVVRGIELNLSCPNVEKGGTGAMKKLKLMKIAVKAARQETDMLLIAQLSPEEKAAVQEFISFIKRRKPESELSPFLAAVEEFMAEHPELLRRLAQ